MFCAIALVLPCSVFPCFHVFAPIEVPNMNSEESREGIEVAPRLNLKSARLQYNDKLISAVQKRPTIWDCRRTDYKDQRKKTAAWEDVVAEIGRDPEGKFPISH